MFRYLYLYIVGSIPSGLCNTLGMSLDVSSTNIDCYSGCLTSSLIVITGISDVCPDGSILRRFIIIVCCMMIFVIASTCTFTNRIGVGVRLHNNNMSSFYTSCYNCFITDDML